MKEEEDIGKTVLKRAISSQPSPLVSSVEAIVIIGLGRGNERDALWAWIRGACTNGELPESSPQPFLSSENWGSQA